MKRVTVVLMLALLALLAMGTVAYAATTQDIVNDFLADGDLDGTYTQAELQAALDGTTEDQYLSADQVAGLHAAINAELAALTAGEEEGTFPFTGFEMAIALLGGAALLGGGVLIRKWAR